MELKRDLQTKKMYLVNNEKILLETGRAGAEFVICLYTDETISVTKETDEYLYGNLKQLVANEYVFDNNGLSYKTDDMIVWFSDQYCDLDDEEQKDMVNRLVLKCSNSDVQISFENPFSKKYGIKKDKNFIAFSPAR